MPHGRAEGRRRFLQLGEGAPGQVVCAQGVLEPRVGRAGIDEECMTQLSYIAQALHGGCVGDRECLRIEPNVVPQRIAYDLEAAHGRGGGRTVAVVW